MTDTPPPLQGETPAECPTCGAPTLKAVAKVGEPSYAYALGARGVSVPERGWQPMSSAPKDGSRFIGWDEYFSVLLFTLHWSDASQAFFTDYEKWSGRFTHWMPLPPAPAPASEGGE